MNTVLKYEEQAVFTLRSLYAKYGYTQYKMSKFEEYDLYVRNKDFLISDSVITFTDTSGKLMALKPDVTLSILKNGKDAPGCVQKVYYNENVYRVSGSTHSFKEIMQVGLECIGDIDGYCLYETLMLAAKSLLSISKNAVLDISHLGILGAVLDSLAVPADKRDAILHCIGEKNMHELCALCNAAGVDGDGTELLRQLVALYGDPRTVLPKLNTLLCGKVDAALLGEFTDLLSALAESEFGDILRIDFSVVHDIRYYNGIVFKGFIEDIPTGVLSGGQYDRLLQKMGRKAGAIGFAVYLDQLERMQKPEKKYDADVLLLYGADTDLCTLRAAVDKLTAEGKSVSAQKRVPEKGAFRETVRLSESEVSV